MDVNGTSQINVDLLVEAGDGGGGAPVPSGCSRTSLVFFFTASAMWGKQQGGIFFCWRVIGLGLWVQIGTADGKKCFAVDAALLTVGVVLGGRMQKLGHTPHALPITCGRRAAVEGREGSGRLRRKVV